MNFYSLRYALQGLSAYRILLDDDNETVLDYVTTLSLRHIAVPWKGVYTI